MMKTHVISALVGLGLAGLTVDSAVAEVPADIREMLEGDVAVEQETPQQRRRSSASDSADRPSPSSTDQDSPAGTPEADRQLDEALMRLRNVSRYRAEQQRAYDKRMGSAVTQMRQRWQDGLPEPPESPGANVSADQAETVQRLRENIARQLEGITEGTPAVGTEPTPLSLTPSPRQSRETRPLPLDGHGTEGEPDGTSVPAEPSAPEPPTDAEPTGDDVGENMEDAASEPSAEARAQQLEALAQELLDTAADLRQSHDQQEDSSR